MELISELRSVTCHNTRRKWKHPR